MSVDWEEVNTKLPFARTKVSLQTGKIICAIYSIFQDDYAKRKELWDAVDVNGNGYLSLAEVTKVLQIISFMTIG